jgi:hypothetical protein
MTPEFKAKWLADLRSGAYPKTTRHLKDDKGYCCLGVALCTLGAGWRSDGTQYTDNGVVAGLYYMPLDFDDMEVNSGNELSEFGMELLGLEKGDHDELIRLNDLIHLNDERDTFDEVIGYIEANL